MDIKEFNVGEKSVHFALANMETQRDYSALSFDTILALAERIKLEEKND